MNWGRVGRRTNQTPEPLGRAPQLTIFSTAKPFLGSAAVLQRNAITSWTVLDLASEIILFGDEAGVAELCDELRVKHVPEVARSESGSPLMPDMFERAQQQSRGQFICYVNSDIVLMSDFEEGVRTLLAWREAKPFLACGMRWNVWVHDPIDFSSDWEGPLRQEIDNDPVGTAGNVRALDYFVFPRGALREMPPFVVGRPGWDNWMVYSARAARIPVVDLSPIVQVVHQRHDYGHHPDGERGVYLGEEARRNIDLAESAAPHPGEGSGDAGSADFGLPDATHVLTRSGVRPVWRVSKFKSWIRQETRRLPILHPRLAPAFLWGRTVYRRLRRSGPNE